MNWFAKYLLSVLVALLVSGCILTDEEKEQQGTVNGVSLCIEKNEKQGALLSKGVIESQCIQKHEKFENYVRKKDNLASVTVQEDKLRLHVTDFQNEFSAFVITSMKLEANYRDAEGVEKQFPEWKSGLWIEPNSTREVILEIPLPEKNTAKIDQFCNRVDVKVNCKSWDILGFRGLDIKLN